MARRKKDTLSRRTGTRKYRPVCWISAEGQTERDYLRMAAFKDAPVSVRFPKDIHPGRRNPAQVLNASSRRYEERRGGQLMGNCWRRLAQAPPADGLQFPRRI